MFLFEVIDTGFGIAPEQQQTIFEPFHQESGGIQKGGTGLGLAIAHRHVELMGSQIEIHSTPGEGTQFSFALTLETHEQSSQPSQQIDDSNWAQVQHLSEGQTISALVVDDVATNRDVMQQILQKIGVTVRTADSGEQALGLVAEHIPDIVFTDIRMPGGMNGVETMKRLFAEHGNDKMKIIAVTASVFEHQRAVYQKEGFDDFLDKPVRMEQIYACLSEHLNVTYTYTTRPTDASVSNTDWQNIVVPTEVKLALIQAVDTQSVTDLRRSIDTLSTLGNDFTPLVSRLRHLSAQYDMAGIKTTLETLPSAE